MTLRFFCIFAAITMLVASGLSGCGDKPAPSNTAVASGSIASQSTGPTASSATGKAPDAELASYTDADLSVPEDFEVEADGAVRTDTYKRALDLLAKEIEKPR